MRSRDQKAAARLTNHNLQEMPGADRPQDRNSAVRELVEPDRIRARPEPPVAEHDEECAFLPVVWMAPRPEAEPRFEIVDDAAPTIEVPLRGDGRQQQQIERERRY